MEPFAISRVTNRYLLFDVNVIMHARRVHNITGVLVGTIPNLSQQNVYLGIPLELMPEEARVLVERGVAYVVDDTDAHRAGFMEMTREDRLSYLQDMDEAGRERSREVQRQGEERTKKALMNRGLERLLKENNETPGPVTLNLQSGDASIFDTTSPSPAPSSRFEKRLDPHFLTPTTSHPPLSQSTQYVERLPVVPRQYPLFRHLHSKGYFMMPGLRFGCHYSVYPGDLLRFHSHFLATGLDWDEEFDLLDVIGGGRLSTRVKKAYLIGGETGKLAGSEHEGNLRAFSIEWAGL
jgi:tRNA-splicing endonuclease subunit Sen34